MLRALLLFASLASLPQLQAQDLPCSPAPCPFQNISLRPEVRAADLVQRMTLEEKVSQTMDHAIAIPRLGIPEYGWWSEALHGVARNGTATVFPQAIAIAATWDPTLVHTLGEVIATEARAKYNVAVGNNRFARYAGLTFWSPNINIFRDPRWGRGQETYGEDPFLTATTGVAFIRGLQGDDATYFKVIATPKHFAVHSGPEPSRHGFDATPSPFDLEDTYLPAFRAAITQGHADSIMCAYNAVDHVPACASSMLLQEYLRTAWHFNGFVVSDCDAVDDVRKGHHFAADAPHAAAVSLQAGTDLDCGSAYSALGAAVKDGLLPPATLDTALVRLFTARIRLGMFDPPSRVPFSKLSAADVDTAANCRLALQVARESIVLLDNKQHILPLTRSRKIAVVGPTAELRQAIDGNYQGTALQPVLPLQGMIHQFGAESVTYAPGAALADGITYPIPSTALRVAHDSSAHGLTADYFNNPRLAGQPTLHRVDDRLNFNWESSIPGPNLPQSNFSVRWTGSLIFPAPGTYTLHVRGIPRNRPAPDSTGENPQASAAAGPIPAARVFLDDRLIIDSGTNQSSAEVPVPVAGAHALRVEYARVSNDRYVSLEWMPPSGALLQDAVQAAQASDLVVAFVGLSPDLEGEEMSVHVPGFESGDRTSLDLPLPQEQLLEQMKATGKPLIVVLTSGSAVALNWAHANADAVLEAWYGGEQAGTAIADTIAGINNPAGRLPVTFYRTVADLPAFDDYSMANRTYRYFTGDPLYPFGFGLSYSSFAYAAPTLSASAIHAGDPVTLKTRVTNTGKAEGDEVVEVYLQAPGGRPGARPALAGYQRVHLKPGESKAVSVLIQPPQFSRVNPRGERSISPGTYRLFASGTQPAAGSPGVPLVVTGNKTLPR